MRVHSISRYVFSLYPTLNFNDNGSEFLHVKKEDKTFHLTHGRIVNNVIIHNFIVIDPRQNKIFFTF